MRFPSYQAAVAYITAWAGDNMYTIAEVVPYRAAADHVRCLEGVSAPDQQWARDAFESGDFNDVTLSLASADAQLGYILMFYGPDGYVARVFGYSCYY